MRPFVEDVALEVLKTIITNDTRNLSRVAEEENQDPADFAVAVAFDYAELFVHEYSERFHRPVKKRSRK